MEGLTRPSAREVDAVTVLLKAVDDLLEAYRERYAKPSTAGLRSNAPLRREMGELKIAADRARSLAA